MLDKTKLKDIKGDLSDFELSEFIPIVAHYDECTLLTRNGELLQTIEITGANAVADVETLREYVSKALYESISDYKISVYLHTVRSRKNVMPQGKYESDFATLLDEQWCKFNNFDKQLINTVYITIVHQGLYDMSLAQSLKFSIVKSAHQKFLEDVRVKLGNVVANVLTALKDHGARLLSLIEVEDGFLSEPLVFYYQLLHMEQRKVVLSPEDVSRILSGVKLTYEFNSLEVNSTHNKQYAAVFSIKDHYEASVSYLDKFMHLGVQYIITQVIMYVPAKEATKVYKHTADIGVISKSEDINEITGFSRFTKADTGRACDYCKQQTLLTVFSDDRKFFEDKVKQLSKKLGELGLMFVREDFNMARLFWSQLPGNFRFLSGGRFSYLDSRSIAGFCSIMDHESGNHRGGKWGMPISLLRNTYGTPFYLNFHNAEGEGHTMLVGPKGSGKTVVSRFLLTQAMKVNPRIIYMDVEGNAKKYIKAIGGEYVEDVDIVDRFEISPFENFNTAEFAAWLIEAICPKASELDKYREIFAAIAERINGVSGVKEKVEALGQLLQNIGDTEINERFESFFAKGGGFDQYFSPNNEVLDIYSNSRQSVIAFNLRSMLVKDQGVFKAYALMMLLNIVRLLDSSRPTIIYINNYNKLLEIKYYRENATNLMKLMTDHNAMLLVNLTHEEYFEKDEAFQESGHHFASKVFLSDKFADKYFKRAYKLDDNELHKIKSYSSSRRVFLFKNEDISTMLSLDLSAIKSELEVLGVTDA